MTGRAPTSIRPERAPKPSAAGSRGLSLLPGRLAVVKLDLGAPWPGWLMGDFWSVTRTSQALSLVCEEAVLPDGLAAERGWRALEVAGPIDFGEIGVLASLAAPLRDAKISIFALSTFDTDYVLVRESDLENALAALEDAGWVRRSA